MSDPSPVGWPISVRIDKHYKKQTVTQSSIVKSGAFFVPNRAKYKENSNLHRRPYSAVAVRFAEFPGNTCKHGGLFQTERLKGVALFRPKRCLQWTGVLVAHFEPSSIRVARRYHHLARSRRSDYRRRPVRTCGSVRPLPRMSYSHQPNASSCCMASRRAAVKCFSSRV